jgi:hypothetical protein
LNYHNHNYFKRAWGFFSFFSSTNVETKNVCPIAYNGLQIGGRFNAANVLLALVALRGIRKNLKTKI